MEETVHNLASKILWLYKLLGEKKPLQKSSFYKYKQALI